MLAPHFVHGRPVVPPFPEHMRVAIVAMGCFWGAERKFWAIPGVFTTAVGYCGGHKEKPTYREVCGKGTGHAEAVLIVFDPDVVAYDLLLRVFWESHDPTQGDRQGNDVGPQYRSAVFVADEAQSHAAITSRDSFQLRLSAAGFGRITTQIATAGPFWYAEEYHQQYLAKNPGGYCGLGGTGVSCPIGVIPA